MKILYLVPYTPTPIRTRPYNLIRGLASQDHQVVLATVWENAAERQALKRLSDDGIQVLSTQLTKGQILKNLFSAVTLRQPLQARYSWHPMLAKKLAELVSGRTENGKSQPYCDIIHIEHLRGAVYGLHLQTAAQNVPLVWDSVDHISSLFEQAVSKSTGGFGRWVTRLELPGTRRYEIELTRRFRRVLVTSPIDQAAFTRMASQNSVRPDISVLTNGVDLEGFRPAGKPRQPDTIVFSGKLSYHANIAAASFLVNQVMPIVWLKRPQVRVKLVGKDPPPDLKRLTGADGRVEVIGTVPDLSLYLQQASVAAATLTYGAGIQNKVLEAMACETPVVATSLAVSAINAIPGRDLLVAEKPGDLAVHIIDLLENPDLQQMIGKNGRSYVEREHNWKEITGRLVNLYEDIINTSHSSISQG
jgi:polysaccharide biosynthesis protein PslH